MRATCLLRPVGRSSRLRREISRWCSRTVGSRDGRSAVDLTACRTNARLRPVLVDKRLEQKCGCPRLGFGPKNIARTGRGEEKRSRNGAERYDGKKLARTGLDSGWVNGR
jgi:hypothetical protein